MLLVYPSISIPNFNTIERCTLSITTHFGQHVRYGVRGMNYLQEGTGEGSIIESVLIPVMREGGWKPRMTLCVSSQASILKTPSHLKAHFRITVVLKQRCR